MEEPEVCSYGYPPVYSGVIETMPASSASLPSSSPAAAVPIPYVAYPVQQPQQALMFDDDDEEQVPLVQSYVSHMLLACFTFWCCGCVCGAIAFVLAGVFYQLITAVCYISIAACQIRWPFNFLRYINLIDWLMTDWFIVGSYADIFEQEVVWMCRHVPHEAPSLFHGTATHHCADVQSAQWCVGTFSKTDTAICRFYRASAYWRAILI